MIKILDFELLRGFVFLSVAISIQLKVILLLLDTKSSQKNLYLKNMSIWDSCWIAIYRTSLNHMPKIIFFYFGCFISFIPYINIIHTLPTSVLHIRREVWQEVVWVMIQLHALCLFVCVYETKMNIRIKHFNQHDH